jgi:hypothetical protein
MNRHDAMKKPVFLLLLTVCGLHAEPLAIQITNLNGEPTAAFLIGAEKDGIVISTAPNGGSSYKLPLTNIRDMTIDEPKGWSLAMQTFAAGNHSEAEKLFAQLGDEFDKLVPLQDSFGSVASVHVTAKAGPLCRSGEGDGQATRESVELQCALHRGLR